MTETRTLSLFEALAKYPGCPYLSDLHYIKEIARKKLIDKLEATALGNYPLGDWKEALGYLISAPPSPPEEARRRLLHHYRTNEAPPLSQFPKGGQEYESE